VVESQCYSFFGQQKNFGLWINCFLLYRVCNERRKLMQKRTSASGVKNNEMENDLIGQMNINWLIKLFSFLLLFFKYINLFL
jgi:hypothetical protein